MRRSLAVPNTPRQSVLTMPALEFVRARASRGGRRTSPPQLRLRFVLLMSTMVVMVMATATVALATATAADNDSEQLRLAAAPVTTERVSGCGLCARNGECERAFRGALGQFCLVLVPGAPCCCPADAQCVLSNAYNCRCRRSASVKSNGNGAHVRSAADPDAHSNTVAYMVIVLLLLALCWIRCCGDGCGDDDSYYGGGTSGSSGFGLGFNLSLVLGGDHDHDSGVSASTFDFSGVAGGDDGPLCSHMRRRSTNTSTPARSTSDSAFGGGSFL